MGILLMFASLFKNQERSTMKSFIIGLLAIAVLALAGCNTVKGMGQDIQKAGSAIEGVGKKN